MRKKIFQAALLVLFLAVGASAQLGFTMFDYHAGKTWSVYRAVDSDYPMYIWHDGTDTHAGTAVTAAQCSVIADDSLILYINAAKDTRFSTDGQVGVAAGEEADSAGKLADLINAIPGWHCQLVDAIRVDLTTNISTLALTNCYKTEVGIKRDNSDTKQLGAGLVRHGYGKSNEGCVVFLESFYTNVVEGTNDSDHVVEVWVCDDEDGVDTKVWSRTPLILSGANFHWPIYGGTGFPQIAGEPGQRIVVRVLCADANEPGDASSIGVTGGIVKLH